MHRHTHGGNPDHPAAQGNPSQAGTARAQKLTLSQYVRKALETEQFLDVFEAARARSIPQARKRGIYTDEDVFARIS